MCKCILILFYISAFVIGIRSDKETIEFRWIEQKLDHFHKNPRTFKMVSRIWHIFLKVLNHSHFTEIYGQGRLFQAKWHNIFLYWWGGNNFIAYYKCF